MPEKRLDETPGGAADEKVHSKRAADPGIEKVNTERANVQDVHVEPVDAGGINIKADCTADTAADTEGTTIEMLAIALEGNEEYTAESAIDVLRVAPSDQGSAKGGQVALDSTAELTIDGSAISLANISTAEGNRNEERVVTGTMERDGVVTAEETTERVWTLERAKGSTLAFTNFQYPGKAYGREYVSTSHPIRQT